MTEQEILDNAPEGATHIDTEGGYYKIETVYQYEDESDCGYEDRFRLISSGDWVVDHDDLLLARSLADIKRIAELEHHNRLGIEALKVGGKMNQALTSKVAELENAIRSNCYDEPSTSCKRLMALVEQGK